MSQENVEVIKAGFAAWNAGDTDALREVFDPEAIIVRGLDGWPEPAPFVGREAVLRQLQESREIWDAETMEPVDFIDGGDRVVVRQIWHSAGRGLESNMEFTVIYTLRNGRAFLLEYFWDYGEALEALGLSEQDAHADPRSSYP